MSGGWNDPKPDREVAEYLETGKTEKPKPGKKYGGAANLWGGKPPVDVLNYLETGKSPMGEPRKNAKKTDNEWRPTPSDDLLKYLGGNGAGGKIGEKLAQVQNEPDIDDYFETFEKWNSGNARNSSDENAYEAVGKFKPLPATVEEVQEFLKKTINSRAGLFASYCLNEICQKDEIELHVNKSHNFLGAYNSGKKWRIHGNVGDKAGREMSGGELVVEGHAGNQFCGEMSGGKAVLYGSAKDFAGAEMNGGELQVNGNVEGSAAYKMKGGYITVQGNARHFAGQDMKGGKVAVVGDAGDRVGDRMKDGVIVVMGNVGEWAGIGMKGGFLEIKGDVNDRAGEDMNGGELRINGKLSKGWTYELANGIRGGNIYHKGKQLYKDGRKVRRWLIF